MDTGGAISPPFGGAAGKIGLWPGEPLRFTDAHYDDMLVWSVQQHASDITVQTDRPVYIEVDGVLYPITRRNLDPADLANALNRFYGPMPCRSWRGAMTSICPMKCVSTATRVFVSGSTSPPS